MKRLVVLLLTLVLLATGCASKASFLDAASPVVQQEADLYRTLVVMSAGVFLVVVGLLIYNITHHQKKVEQQDVAPQHYRQYMIEAIYTGVPILIIIIVFIMMVGVMQTVAAPAAQTGDIHVQVIGHRWWWEFDYPDLKIKTANELHIPANATVQIDVTSLDVIHSFWVPQLGGKVDAIPGVTNHTWLRGDSIGSFYGQCSEYCGLNHANMRLTVFVDSKADFDAWVANQQNPPAEPQTDLQKTGHDIIVNGICGACHDLGDDGPGNATGPNLTHLMSRQRFAGDVFDLNADNLRRWLEDTQAMKPGNDMDHKFSEQQIEALMSYLLTLK